MKPRKTILLIDANPARWRERVYLLYLHGYAVLSSTDEAAIPEGTTYDARVSGEMLDLTNTELLARVKVLCVGKRGPKPRSQTVTKCNALVEEERAA